MQHDFIGILLSFKNREVVPKLYPWYQYSSQFITGGTSGHMSPWDLIILAQ